MNKKIQKALDFLKKNKIDFDFLEHSPVFTVEDVKNLEVKIPGLGVKTLFLKDKKGNNFYLLSISDEKMLDIKKFAEIAGEKRLSFANENNLKEYLDVESGSLSPMALLNVSSEKVKFYIDKDLVESKKVAIHPNLNTATVILKRKEFENFLDLVIDKYNVIEI